jgi:tetratricopeptide (TPR) repeat protein
MLRRIFIFVMLILLTACGVNPAERNNAANWYSAQGSYDTAIAAYQAAQVANPDNPLLYFNAAEALARAGDVEAAAAALNQAIQRGDNELKAMALYNLGNLYFEQQQYQAAVDAYQQSLLLRPNWSDTRYNLELARLYLERPTPTALEQQTQPDQQQADASMTPTPNPAALDQPSPTPTPPGEAPPSGETPDGGRTGENEGGKNATPQPRPGGELDAEEAGKVLDIVEEERPGVVGGIPTYSLPTLTPPSGKDW